MSRPAVRDTSPLAVVSLALLAASVGVYAHYAWSSTAAGWWGLGAGLLFALLVNYVYVRTAVPGFAAVLMTVGPVVAAVVGHLRFREEYGPNAGWLGLAAGLAAALVVVAVAGRVAESRGRRTSGAPGGLYG